MLYAITMKKKPRRDVFSICMKTLYKMEQYTRHEITIELYRVWHVPLVFITCVRTYKLLI